MASSMECQWKKTILSLVVVIIIIIIIILYLPILLLELA